MKIGKLLLPVLLGLCLIGCAPLIFFGAGTAAGVASHMYYQGALTVIYQAPYMETWDATLRVMEGMKFKIKNKKHDLTSGKISAKGEDNKAVTISLKYRSSQETEAVIRVGFPGDKNASMIIKEEIRKELFK